MIPGDSHEPAIQLLDSFVQRIMQALEDRNDPLHQKAHGFFAAIETLLPPAREHGFAETVVLDFFNRDFNLARFIGFTKTVGQAWNLTGEPIYQTMYEQLLRRTPDIIYESSAVNKLWTGEGDGQNTDLSRYLLAAREYIEKYPKPSARDGWGSMYPGNVHKMRQALGIPLQQFHLKCTSLGVYEAHMTIKDSQNQNPWQVFTIDLSADDPVLCHTLDEEPVSQEVTAKVMRLLVRAFELTVAEPQPPSILPPETSSPPAENTPVYSAPRRSHQPQERAPHKRPRQKQTDGDTSSPESVPEEKLYYRPLVVVDDVRVRKQIRKLPREVRKAVGQAIQDNNNLRFDFPSGKELSEGVEGPTKGRVWQIRVGDYRILAEKREDGRAYVYSVAIRSDKDRFKTD